MYDKPISYSGRSAWKKCPHRWHWIYVLGNRQEAGAAASRGTLIHSEIENFFAKGEPLYHSALQPWRRPLEALTIHSPQPEEELAVDKDWSKVRFDDPVAFYRGKTDLKYWAGDTLVYIDWKTGRQYPDHEEQGKSYMALGDEAERYRVEFWYIDQPLSISTFHYTKEDRAEHIDEIKRDVDTIRMANIYPATPCSECKWCPLNWRNGGKCETAP